MAELSIEDFFCSTIASVCGLDIGEITPKSALLDLSIDSLTLVSLLANAEAIYGIELAEDDLHGFLEATDVAGLATRLAKCISSQQNAL
jgi:acyl carrier protein